MSFWIFLAVRTLSLGLSSFLAFSPSAFRPPSGPAGMFRAYSIQRINVRTVFPIFCRFGSVRIRIIWLNLTSGLKKKFNTSTCAGLSFLTNKINYHARKTRKKKLPTKNSDSGLVLKLQLTTDNMKSNFFYSKNKEELKSNGQGM